MGAYPSKLLVVLQGGFIASAAKQSSEIWLDLQICKKSVTQVVSDAGSCCKEWPESPVPKTKFLEMCQTCEAHESSEMDSSCAAANVETLGVRVKMGEYDKTSCSSNAINFVTSMHSDDKEYVCVPACDPFSKSEATKKLCTPYWTKWRSSKHIEGEEEDEEDDDASKPSEQTHKTVKEKEPKQVHGSDKSTAHDDKNKNSRKEDEGEKAEEEENDEEEDGAKASKESGQKEKIAKDKKVLRGTIASMENADKKVEEEDEDAFLGEPTTTNLVEELESLEDSAEKSVEQTFENFKETVTNKTKLKKAAASVKRSVIENAQYYFNTALEDIRSLMRKHSVFFSAIVICAVIGCLVMLGILTGLVEISPVVDLGTAGLMIVDVASDVYVARNYWLHAKAEGQFPIFFTISVCILTISSTFGLVYVLVFDMPEGCKDVYNWFGNNWFQPFVEVCKRKFGPQVGEALANILILLFHALVFVILIPLGSVLPILTYLRGRFCTDGKEQDLKNKIDAAKEEAKKLKLAHAELEKKYKELDGRLAPRLVRMREESRRIEKTIPLIQSTSESDRASSPYVTLLSELQDHSGEIAERLQIENTTARKSDEVRKLKSDLYDAQRGGLTTFGLAVGFTIQEDQRKKIIDIQTKLHTAQDELVKLLANQKGVFKSAGLGCWVSGFHVQQVMDLAKKLEDSRKRENAGGLLDFLERLRDPNSTENLKKQLDAVCEAEKETLMARCRTAPTEMIQTEGMPEEVVTGEGAILQEDIVARFIAQVKPAIDAGQSELDSINTAVNEVVAERNRIVANYLPRLQEARKTAGGEKKAGRTSIISTEERDLRSRMDAETKSVDDTLAPMRQALWEKQSALRVLKTENLRWEKVLTGNRDKCSDELRYAAYELSFKNDEVLHYEIIMKMKTHLPFYVETVLESIPQSLTQTSALVIYGHRMGVSYVSIFSIATSIASIMSKVYVLCGSKIKQVFIFKFVCGCHDIALMFYTISALFQCRRGIDDGVHLWFMTRPVDFFSSIWLYQSFILGCLIAITGWACAIVALGAAVRDLCRNNGCKYYGLDLLGVMLLWCIGVFFATIFGMLPIMVVMQCVRLFFSLAYTVFIEWALDEKAENKDVLAFIAKAFAFLTGKATNEKSNAITMFSWLAINEGEPTDVELERIHKPVTRFQKMKAGVSFAYMRLKRICGLVPLMLQAMDEMRKKPISTASDTTKWLEEVGAFVAAVCAGIMGFTIFVTWYVGVLYSLAYPFLSYGLALHGYHFHDKELNAFQSFLFVAYAGFLSAAIYGQLTIQNNYLAILQVVVDIDELFDQAHRDDAGRAVGKKALDKRHERLKKIGKDGFDRMWDTYFSQQAGENFKVEGNVGWVASCRAMCCCSSEQEKEEAAYELLATEE